MFTIRNMGGVALLLFGSTYMWLMPMMATKGIKTTGGMWATANALSLLAMGGFAVATWGLFTRAEWWALVAIASAVVGSAALGPYWFAATHAGEATPGFNVFVHAIGNIAVVILLLVPVLERWVNGHVMAGR